MQYVTKLARFITQSHDRPLRCLGSAEAVAQGGTVKARVWSGVGAPGFVFPELRHPVEGQMGEATLKTLQALQTLQTQRGHLDPQRGPAECAERLNLAAPWLAV